MSQGLPKRRQAFDASLVLQGTPASVGRTYSVDKRTLRAVIRSEGVWRRYASYRGIVRVEFDDDNPDLLRGRFRIWANEQEYKFWMDFWTGDQEVLLVGEFEAARDEAGGQRILERTEVEELKRGQPIGRPRPVTGPPLDK